jgi:ATP-binding cassette, subfamily B (MDR/TAP), member 1
VRLSQTRELQTATCVGLGNLSMDVVTSIANLVVAFYLSWKLTLVILATVPVSVAILSLVSRKLRPAVEVQKQELAHACRLAMAAVMGIDLVKVFNGADQETWQYFGAISRSMRAYLTQSRASAYQLSYVKFWLEGMFVLGFYYGAVLVDEGMDPGHVLTTFYAALGALQAVESFMPMYLVLAKGMSAGWTLRSVADGMENGRKIQRMTGGYQPKCCVGEIRANDVRLYLLGNGKIV